MLLPSLYHSLAHVAIVIIIAQCWLPQSVSHLASMCDILNPRPNLDTGPSFQLGTLPGSSAGVFFFAVGGGQHFELNGMQFKRPSPCPCISGQKDPVSIEDKAYGLRLIHTSTLNVHRWCIDKV